MTIPRAIVVLFTAIAVTGSGLAQHKPAKKKLEQMPVRPMVKVQQGVKDIVLPVGNRIMFQKFVFVRDVTPRVFRALTAPSNPLMQGEYKAALKVFDRGISGLEVPRDAKVVSKLLDDLCRHLIEVRRALWKAELRARAAKVVATHAVASRMVWSANPPGIKFSFSPAESARIFDPENPYLIGDYQRTIVVLNKVRNSLNGVSDPKAARRIIDTLNRRLFDVRREAWKIDQAQKKKSVKK